MNSTVFLSLSAICLVVFIINTIVVFRRSNPPGKIAWFSSLLLSVIIAATNLFDPGKSITGNDFSNIWTILSLLMIVLVCFIFFTVIITGFRSIEDRSRFPKTVYAVAIIIILVPATIIADLYNIRKGRIGTSGSLYILLDIVFGQAIFWMPVFLYRMLMNIFGKNNSTRNQ